MQRIVVLPALTFFWSAVILIGRILVAGALIPVAAQTINLCTNSVAVPDPEDANLVADCNVLLAAKDTLRGTASLNWSTTIPISQWDGVTVSRSRVTSLWLSDKKLTGRIPAELGSLSALQQLNLYDNQLRGSIPAQLGNLSNLQRLDLNNNQLTGSIPAELGSLSQLHGVVPLC